MKLRSGERCGSVRFGYDLDWSGPMNPVTKKSKRELPARLRPNPSEQLVIWIIRGLGEQGLRSRAIASYLNERKIPTKLGKGPWHHTAVAKILRRVESWQHGPGSR